MNKTRMRVAGMAALFCFVGLGFTGAEPARRQASAAQVGVGIINAAVGSTTLGSVVAGSLVSSGPSSTGGAMTVTIKAGSSYAATLHLYYSTDTASLQQIPDNAVLCVQTGQYGAISSGATGTYQAIIPPGSTGYIGASAWTPGGTLNISNIGVGGSLAKAATQVGKPLRFFAAGSGAVSGSLGSGVHSISHFTGDNGTATTLYLQFFDATSLPSNGAAPIEEIMVPFGISSVGSENQINLGEDWVPFGAGVYYAWSSTSGFLTVVTGGTGLRAAVQGG